MAPPKIMIFPYAQMRIRDAQFWQRTHKKIKRVPNSVSGTPQKAHGSPKDSWIQNPGEIAVKWSAIGIWWGDITQYFCIPRPCKPKAPQQTFSRFSLPFCSEGKVAQYGNSSSNICNNTLVSKTLWIGYFEATREELNSKNLRHVAAYESV